MTLIYSKPVSAPPQIKLRLALMGGMLATV